MMMKLLLVVFAMLCLVACSDDNKVPEGEHVWKEQTEMIDKAKDIEALINQSAQQQRELIEQKTQ